MITTRTNLNTYPFAYNRPVAPFFIGNNKKQKNNEPNENKENPRDKHYINIVNYYADVGGCGHWRMLWAIDMLVKLKEFTNTSSMRMIFDLNFYNNIQTVRFQRQASKVQKGFVEFLVEYKKSKSNSIENIIYEIDDIIFREDIPDYNHGKSAFDDINVRTISEEIMSLVDEISVSTVGLKDYYSNKIGTDRVTHIPNFVPRFWMDRYYNRKDISKNYNLNRKRPRILFSGSSSHFDVAKQVKGRDDFYHVRDAIRKTVKDFKWVFFGNYPPYLKDLIDSGDIEFHDWVDLVKYPETLHSLSPQLFYAPLANNTFNKCKTNLKFVEGCCYGIPTICQDIETYDDAFIKFNTGDEMIDQIKSLIKCKDTYMRNSDRAREHSSNFWLEDNIDYYKELYSYPYGHPKRVKLNKLNNVNI